MQHRPLGQRQRRDGRTARESSGLAGAHERELACMRVREAPKVRVDANGQVHRRRLGCDGAVSGILDGL